MKTSERRISCLPLILFLILSAGVSQVLGAITWEYDFRYVKTFIGYAQDGWAYNTSYSEQSQWDRWVDWMYLEASTYDESLFAHTDVSLETDRFDFDDTTCFDGDLTLNLVGCLENEDYDWVYAEGDIYFQLHFILDQPYTYELFGEMESYYDPQTHHITLYDQMNETWIFYQAGSWQGTDTFYDSGILQPGEYYFYGAIKHHLHVFDGWDNAFGYINYDLILTLVPESTTIFLLLIGSGALLRRRR